MFVILSLVSSVLHVAQKLCRSIALYQILIRIAQKGCYVCNFIARVVGFTRRSKIMSQHSPLSNFVMCVPEY